MRAATSMFLMSLANILPRLASMTAFLCLVVAHLEWPDMQNLRVSGGLADHLDEVPVNAEVAGELRVESRGKQVPLPNGDNPTGGRAVLDTAQHPHVVADLLDPWRADEDGVKIAAGDLLDRHVGLERVDLPAERVAPHRQLDALEGL